uniref:Uncharacterized protein n=1 Tax=Arundo donax TaxID=35708 RepID=A0A0A9ANZ5_ARUDO
MDQLSTSPSQYKLKISCSMYESLSS